MSDVYEWRRFEVGERVRLCIGGECSRRVQAVTYWYTPIGEPDVHPIEANGLVGTVSVIDAPERCPDGHRYVIELPLGTVLPWNGKPALINTIRLAAAELEPLDSES